MKKVWIILVIVLLLFFTILISYIFKSNKVDLKFENAEFVLNSNELSKDFESDESKANTKYLNKVVQVKGKVAEIINTQDNKVIIILKDADMISGINCMIESGKLPSGEIKVGEVLSIKGIVKGFLDDVIIGNCVIIK
jgi:RecJ-like exonuclease